MVDVESEGFDRWTEEEKKEGHRGRAFPGHPVYFLGIWKEWAVICWKVGQDMLNSLRVDFGAGYAFRLSKRHVIEGADASCVIVESSPLGFP